MTRSAPLLIAARFAAMIAILSTNSVGRIWTDQSGNTLEAELLSIDESSEPIQIELQLTNGRRIFVSLDILSDADQAYVLALITATPARTTIRHNPDGSFALRWDSIPGAVYAVERSADLKTWSELTRLTASGTTASHTLSRPEGQTSQFWRVTRITGGGD